MRESIDLYCERGLLGLILAVLVFAPLALGAAHPSDFAIVQWLTVGVLALWGVRVWAVRRFRLFWPPICWAVLVFIIYAVARCHYVDVQYVGNQELGRILVYGVLFFAIINNINRRNSTTLVSLTLIGLAAVLAVFSFYQFATHNPHIWAFAKPAAYAKRGSGTFINPNHFAGFLGMILPLAFAYAIMGRFKPVAKVLLGYTALLLIAGIGVSLSRGGMVAAGVALVAFLVVLVFQRDYWIRAIVMMAAVAVLALGFAQNAGALKKRLSLASEDLSDLNNGRRAYWAIAEDLYKQEPIFGIGPGHYNYEFWHYRPRHLTNIPEYAHNDYLQLLSEWGTVGGVLVGGMILLLLLGILRTWPFVRRDPNELGGKNSTKAAFLLGATFGLVAIAVHSLCDFNMQIPANAILAVTLAALATAQLRFATEGFWKNPGVVGKCLLTACCLAGGTYLSERAWRATCEQNILERAEKAAAYSPEKLALLRQAAQMEPGNFQTAYEIGECLRIEAWQGRAGYQAKAQEAMTWFERAMKVNAHYPFTPLRYGMCLDWLDRCSEATPYFERACALDPNGNLETAYLGWHYIQMENYPKAKEILESSLKTRWSFMATDLLRNVNEQLARKY